MIPSGHLGQIDRYVGYLTPYATSHDDLDRDTDSSRTCATPRSHWCRRSKIDAAENCSRPIAACTKRARK